MEALRESTPDKIFKGLFRADIGAQGPRAAVDDVPALVRDDPKRLAGFRLELPISLHRPSVAFSKSLSVRHHSVGAHRHSTPVQDVADQYAGLNPGEALADYFIVDQQTEH
jgi:hypothetical protein